MTDITLDELERRDQHRKLKPRKGGKIPPLGDDTLDNPERLREWLGVVLRPRPGWQVVDFDYGAEVDTPCTITVRNGADQERYRFRSQRDFNSTSGFQLAVTTITDCQLRPPKMSANELLDVHQALCRLGTRMSAQDELEQAREWMVALLDAARPLLGHSMVNVADRRDALLKLKALGQFTWLDALAIQKHPEDLWPRKPTCLIDQSSRDMWLRAGEAATYVRHILNVRIRNGLLTRRWGEVSIGYEHFDERRSQPRLKGWFYRVPRGWTTE
jgi:hypothetical protein